jgi:hypothetical protein
VTTIEDANLAQEVRQNIIGPDDGRVLDEFLARLFLLGPVDGKESVWLAHSQQGVGCQERVFGRGASDDAIDQGFVPGTLVLDVLDE